MAITCFGRPCTARTSLRYMLCFVALTLFISAAHESFARGGAGDVIETERHKGERAEEMPLPVLEKWVTTSLDMLDQNRSELCFNKRLLDACWVLSVKYAATGNVEQERECHHRILKVVESMRKHGLAERFNTTVFAFSARYGLGDLKGAAEELVRKLDWELDHQEGHLMPHTLQYLGSVYREQGELEKSLLALQESVKRNLMIDNTSLYFDMAKTYEAKGDYEAALHWYEKAVLFWPVEHALRFPTEGVDLLPPHVQRSIPDEKRADRARLRRYIEAYRGCTKKMAGNTLAEWPQWLARPSDSGPLP